MGVIKKFNPETNRWEIYGSTDAKDIKLIDIGNNFETKNVESALREMSEKLNESIAYIEAHSQTLTEHTENIEWLIINGGGGSGGGGGGGGSVIPTITSSFKDNAIIQKGEEVKIEPRKVTIYKLEIVNFFTIITINNITPPSNKSL